MPTTITIIDRVGSVGRDHEGETRVWVGSLESDPATTRVACDSEEIQRVGLGHGDLVMLNCRPSTVDLDSAGEWTVLFVGTKIQKVEERLSAGIEAHAD